MLRLVQNWFAPRAHPIGIDLGTDSLRLAQVHLVDREFTLAAAASVDVPSHVRSNPQARMLWFTEAVRELLSHGNFQGRQAVLGLPASLMHIQHLRMVKLDDETLKKTLPFEARGKLPIDPGLCLLRHIVAGDIFSEQEPKSEVIVLAAARELVNQFLDAAAKARLDVVGMNVEPKALIDCFANVYRRKADLETTNCFVDIGAVATRATIAHGDDILFARSIPVGGDAFTKSVAKAMNLGVEQARLLRMQSAAQAAAAALEEKRDQVAADAPRSAENSFALPGAAQHPVDTATKPATSPQSAVEQACLEPLTRLIEELNLCRRYHEATFSNKPVNRLIFVGGEARQKWLCQHVARSMQLAAQIGDPLVRMRNTTDVGSEAGIDRRQPQPAWAVAVGLSMGPERIAAGKAADRAERLVQKGAA